MHEVEAKEIKQVWDLFWNEAGKKTEEITFKPLWETKAFRFCLLVRQLEPICDTVTVLIHIIYNAAGS